MSSSRLRISASPGSGKSTIVMSFSNSGGIRSIGATMTSTRAAVPLWNAAATSRTRRTSVASAGRAEPSPRWAWKSRNTKTPGLGVVQNPVESLGGVCGSDCGLPSGPTIPRVTDQVHNGRGVRTRSASDATAATSRSARALLRTTRCTAPGIEP